MAKQVEKGNLERMDAAKQVSRALGSNEDMNQVSDAQLEKSIGRMEGVTFDFNGFPLKVHELDPSKFKQIQVFAKTRITKYVAS